MNVAEVEILYQGLNWHIDVTGLYINNTEKEPILSHLYEVALAYKNKSQECEKLKEKLKEQNKYSVGFAEKCQRLELDILHLKDENNRLKRELKPFKDDYFKDLDTKTIAELAKKSIRLTTENRKLENALDEIEELNKQMLQTKIPFCTINERIQNVINKAKDGGAE